MSNAKGCMFRRIIDGGDTSDRETLQALLNSERTNTDLARTFTDAGIPMSEHTVRRHRKNDCSCGWL